MESVENTAFLGSSASIEIPAGHNQRFQIDSEDEMERLSGVGTSLRLREAPLDDMSELKIGDRFQLTDEATLVLWGINRYHCPKGTWIELREAPEPADVIQESPSGKTPQQLDGYR